VFPVIWLLGIVVISGAARTEEKTEEKGDRIATLVPAVLLSVYCIGWLIPFRCPEQRFTQGLEEVWRGSTGNTSYHIYNEASRETWNLHGRRTEYVANLGWLNTALQIARSGEAVTTGPVQDSLYRMLAMGDHTAASTLGAKPEPRVAPQSGQNEPPEVGDTRATLMTLKMKPEILATCPELTDTGLQAGWYMSPMEITGVMTQLLKEDLPSKPLILPALENGRWNYGLARHLRTHGRRYVFAAHTLRTHAEVIRFEGPDKSQWTAGVIRKEDVPRLGIDQPALRNMGMF
jgi:hypothetical protein